jgi:hypothetical protein
MDIQNKNKIKYYKTADDVFCDVERRVNQVCFYFQNVIIFHETRAI